YGLPRLRSGCIPNERNRSGTNVRSHAHTRDPHHPPALFSYTLCSFCCRIHLFVIPEVAQLIVRELTNAKMPATGSTGVRKYLEEISAWLVVNSMRSERVQFNMLCLQNTTNVWRK